LSHKHPDRRSFLGIAGAFTATGSLTKQLSGFAPQRLPEGKIIGYDPVIIQVNDVGEGTWDLIILSTDIGVTGLGEASHSGRFESKIEAMSELFPLLEGLSPFQVELFRDRFLSRGPHEDGALTTAFSGMEQAMWDLAGKLAGVSVSHLLGGPIRSSIRAYANINRATRGAERTPDGFASNARRALSAGFTAIKMAPFDDMASAQERPSDWKQTAEPGIERIAAVRQAIGPETDLLIDVHSHFDVDLTIKMANRLAPYNLFWIEEPVPSKKAEEAGQVTKSIDTQTAGGEHLFGMNLFGDLLKTGGWDVFMPDVKHCGGILEMRKIAAIAECGSHKCAPHNPTGPVATAASVQCCATMPNFLILEYAWGETDWSCDLITPREEFVDGFLRVGNEPGLGINLNMDTVEAHRITV
jgi:galactonate dehydratase